MMDQQNGFLYAANEQLTCKDCRYCQTNMKVKNVRDGFLCMNTSNNQNGYYGVQYIVVNEKYLCNQFESVKL